MAQDGSKFVSLMHWPLLSYYMTILSGMVQAIPQSIQLQAVVSNPRLMSQVGRVCKVMCACIIVFLQGKKSVPQCHDDLKLFSFTNMSVFFGIFV